jgi:hypothetical protein
MSGSGFRGGIAKKFRADLVAAPHFTRAGRPLPFFDQNKVKVLGRL